MNLPEPLPLRTKYIESIVSFLCGITFALGVTVAGITDPQMLVRFFSIGSDWSASAGIVLVTATLTHFLFFKYFKKLQKPLFSPKAHVPKGQDITWPLVSGSVIFGAGLAIGGLCPGSGLIISGSGNWSGLAFSIAMAVGMAAHWFFQQITGHKN